MNNTMRLGVRKFYDDINFAGGISRSGFFNIKESENLISYGYTLSGLASGQLIPQNDEEQRFVEQINAEQDSELYFVKLWRKYKRALYLSKHKASLNGRKIEAPQHYAFESDTDVDDDFSGDELDDDF
jgi:uncharacterized protein